MVVESIKADAKAAKAIQYSTLQKVGGALWFAAGASEPAASDKSSPGSSTGTGMPSIATVSCSSGHAYIACGVMV